MVGGVTAASTTAMFGPSAALTYSSSPTSTIPDAPGIGSVVMSEPSASKTGSAGVPLPPLTKR